MTAYVSPFLLLAFLTNFRPSIQQHNPNYIGYVCTTWRTYPKNSTYSSKLGTLFSSLSSSNTFSNGFYSTASGQNPDLVFGLYLCRGDVSTEICHDCVVYGVCDILNRCPDGKEALLYYDECMLRYADRNILLDPISTRTGIKMVNHQNISANISGRFDKVLFALMNKAADEAAGSPKKFAIKKTSITSSQTVYVMVQCTPDLTRENCSSCLQSTIAQLPRYKIGARLLWPSCTVRYEPYPFFNETVAGSKLPPPVSSPPLSSRQALLSPPQPHKISLSPFTTFMEF